MFKGSERGSEGVLAISSVFHVEQSPYPTLFPASVSSFSVCNGTSFWGWSVSISFIEISLFDLKLNNGAGDSPFCSEHLVKSHEVDLSLGGVPVLSLISSKPSLSRDSERRFAAGRLSPPDSSTSCPMKIRPLREVPLVMTTALAAYSPCSSVLTPFTFPVTILRSQKGNTFFSSCISF